MDTSEQSPSLLSLCPGLCGLERGLEQSIGPVRTVAYVEIESFIITNLVRQMEQGLLAPAPVWSDVKTFLPIAQQLRGKVDGISGGYPCQPFSHVGRRAGASDPRHLWPFFADIIRAIGPVFCWFENVSNHIHIGYREVRSGLEKLGYTVKEGLFSAEEVGAPHLRKRLFILAVANTHHKSGRFKQLLTCSDGGRTWNQLVGSEVRAGRISAGVPGYELGDPDSERQYEPSGIIGEGIGRIAHAGHEVDHAIKSGLEGYARPDGRAEGWEGPGGSASPASFPLGQGDLQWEWEEPRVKSRLGLTVNGYNYREDLLRLAGNAVVWQTSERAFRTLARAFL